MKASGWPSKIASPFGGRDLPHHSAHIRTDDVSIFIASITKSCWPRVTESPAFASTEMIVPCIGAQIAIVPSGISISVVDATAIGDNCQLIAHRHRRFAQGQYGKWIAGVDFRADLP